MRLRIAFILSTSICYAQLDSRSSESESSAVDCFGLFLARLNVLIHAKEIIGVVFIFDSNQSLVVITIGRFHAIFSFVSHQEVYLCSASRVGM